jgi:hypothetical protein
MKVQGKYEILWFNCRVAICRKQNGIWEPCKNHAQGTVVNMDVEQGDGCLVTNSATIQWDDGRLETLMHTDGKDASGLWRLENISVL